MTQLKYRPEIDGLRALAVLAVIIYHSEIYFFNSSYFSGGFIGVDIFFVISGYLITSIILKELLLKGKISIKYFYERRIRRILPVLLLVILVSILFAWFFFLHDRFIDFSKSILFSLGFISNFYFYFTGQEYGAQSSLLKPFLHTWSLSIEEQFYIFFPFFLIIIYKYFKKYLLTILLLLFFLSLFFAEFFSKYSHNLNYFFIHTRLWELVLGSILAYIEINFDFKKRITVLNQIFPILGLFLIGHSFVFFNSTLNHPSLITLSPVIGVSLIIWFANKDELVTRILSIKLLVKTGLISYSLYLWHFPILAFDRIIEYSQDSITKKIIILLLIFLLSALTYYFIEIPSRNKRINFKYIFSILIFIIITIISFNLFVIYNNGFKSRLPLILQSEFSESPLDLLKNENGEKCNDHLEGCSFNNHFTKQVFLIGDCHMGSLMFDLKDKLTENKFGLKTYIYGSCPYFPGFNKVNSKSQIVDKLCNNNLFNILENIFFSQKNSIFIFGGRFPVYLNNNYFDNQEGGVEEGLVESKFLSNGRFKDIEESYKNSLYNLSKNNKIILIYPIPEVGWDTQQKFNKLFPKKKFLNKKISISELTTDYEVYKSRARSTFELFDSIIGKNIYRVYPHRLFCDSAVKQRCITHDNENIFYSNSNILSIKGAEMVNQLIIKKLNIIEK